MISFNRVWCSGRCGNSFLRLESRVSFERLNNRVDCFQTNHGVFVGFLLHRTFLVNRPSYDSVYFLIFYCVLYTLRTLTFLYVKTWRASVHEKRDHHGVRFSHVVGVQRSRRTRRAPSIIASCACACEWVCVRERCSSSCASVRLLSLLLLQCVCVQRHIQTWRCGV